jgi:Acetyltransferase (GNAT) domain
VAAHAELIADQGAAAESADFFRARPFLDAEEVTHTLLISAGDSTIALPVIVRDVPGADARDAISPYGYPGARVERSAGPPPHREEVEWSATGLVSVFVRDRIGSQPCLSGATRRAAVQVHDSSRPRRLRARFAEQIRRNERVGYEVELAPGPKASADARAAFVAAYLETMHRAGADERYLFDPSYFERILRFAGSHLWLARAPGGEPAAGAIAALSDGVLHYYLGGTRDAHLSHSPFKNVVAAMIGLADDLGLPLNLGGGVRAGDGLEDFKRGFANSELPFHTHEIVCDRQAYEDLSEGAPEGDYFPAYRSA